MNSYNMFSIRHGSYDFLHPDEEQTQVIFRLREDAPFEHKQFGIVVDGFDYDMEDFDTVWECAYELNKVVQHYLINSDKKIMDFLLPYLEKYRLQDKLAFLLDEQTQLLKRIREVEYRIAYVRREIEEDDGG